MKVLPPALVTEGFPREHLSGRGVGESASVADDPGQHADAGQSPYLDGHGTCESNRALAGRSPGGARMKTGPPDGS